MKKLFNLFLVSFFLFGCIGISVKTTEVELKGLKEIEGMELLKWEDLTIHSLSTIEKWEITFREIFEAEKSAGSAPMHQYETINYMVPNTNGMGHYCVTYVLLGENRRAETLAFLIYPYGVVAIFDRYWNTDKWYLWNMGAYLEQHPEDKDELPKNPERFERRNAL